MEGSTVMPVDPTTDPDFMSAQPHEQMAYLSHVDSDFAKASPQDQLGYLMHIRGLSSNISGPAAPPMGMSQVDITGKPQTPEAATAGLPGMTGNRPVKGADLVPGAIVGGAAAAAAAPAALSAGG